MKPPHDQEPNPWAEQLTELLANDCAKLLIEASRDEGVRDAVAALLEALVRARLTKAA